MEYQETPSTQQRESIDRLAGEFEAAYRAGQRPEIERVVADNSGLRGYLLRELIALEIQLRRSSGQQPSVDEYRQRFPADDALIEAIFFPAREMVSTLDQSLHTDVVQQSLPKNLGRYIIQRLLGKGGFGVVYLAHDPQLDRFVALKIPRRERFSTVEHVTSFIQEARMVAKLKHPGLVAVHDVQEDAGLPYIVQEYIDGDNLAVWAAKHQPSFEQIAIILISISEALGYAHQQRLTHCDLKLANVLIDQQGRPYVSDFGLAVHDSVRGSRKGSRFGTPSMMAPEQVRGEGHRLDGRTDIWALGVMLYELLVSQKPFAANSHDELFNEIETLDPRPPRQIDRYVPRELERICLKCLQKRRTERYSTADDLREDLQAWLAQGISTEVPQSSTVVARDSSSTIPVPDSSTKAPSKIIPKGLRSFDAEDADFFLDLLPGPRDRDGLPSSIRFWKHRIEENDLDKTFAVGLIYGPSGCGKSSLVKAGLMPQLSDTVLPIYIEATAADTEVRILKQLHKQMPRLSTDLSLPEACAELRQTGAGRHRKLLIVIDQFEQWLHAHPELKQTQLVDALRQCEGGRLQALLLVRDDFFASVHRLYQELEDPLVEGSNYALVDRFDKQHSRKVLAALGRAHSKFEEKLSDLQEQFVIQAVEELAEDEKVICVRLSLFADMMKSRPWTLTSLREIGGMSGVGVIFLDETFSVKTAPPSHRVHEQAIRQVLKALLPKAGTDIKGSMRSEKLLCEAAGYQNEPVRFAEVMRILDDELRIITPAELDGHAMAGFPDQSDCAVSSSASHYQLTHDYLVTSLREWLTRKQKETQKGRAELILEERSALWNTNLENRYLPSLFEWLRIRMLTESKQWTQSHRKMIFKAGMFHGVRLALVGMLICALIVIGIGFREITVANGLVYTLLNANTSEVSKTIDKLKGFRKWADPQIRKAFATEPDVSNAKLHAGLALVADGQTVDPVVIHFLQERLLSVTPSQFQPVRSLLEPHSAELTATYRALAQDAKQPVYRRFHAACALAAYDTTDATWNDSRFKSFVCERLVVVDPVFVGHYKDLLRPVAPKLVSTLASIFKEPTRGELARTIAATLLVDYSGDDLETLTELVVAADISAHKILFPAIQKNRNEAIKKLEDVLAKRLKPDWRDPSLNPSWREPEPAILAKFRESHGLIAERFAFCQDMAWETFQDVKDSLRTSGYRPTRVRPWLRAEQTEEPVLIGAVWDRVGSDWDLQTNLTKSEMPAFDTPATRNGMMLADISRIPNANGFSDATWVALWAEPDNTKEERRLVVDANESELWEISAVLAKQGFVSQCATSVWIDGDGQRKYSGIWSNVGAASELRPAYGGFELFAQPQFDIAVCARSKFASSLDESRRISAKTERPPVRGLEDSKAKEDRYAALWRADVNIESRNLFAVPIESVLEQLKPLISDGYRPVAIAAEAVRDTTGALVQSGGAGLCSLILHRPLVPDDLKEQLAIEQAAAATALLKLDAAEHVWQIFLDQKDPRLRSQLLHNLASYGVDPESVMTELSFREANVSIQRALIVAVGEFARVKQLSAEQRSAAIFDLARRYSEDLDAGIHGACEWSLRQLGADEKIAEVRSAYSTGKPIGERRWYLTKTGADSSFGHGLSFAILDATDEFLMGSPVSEKSRFRGPTGKREIRHRRHVGRIFAIGLHEVTVAQFQAFLKDYPNLNVQPIDREIAKEEDAPANNTRWYHAALFCNWLSKKEGLSPEEWCYDPTQPFSAGMTLYSNYLQRKGYRLPTEAEWEFACRSLTTTSRYYGETETLLGEYACYTKNSRDLQTFRVGTLKPNQSGLFDMLGNVYEWCQDRSIFLYDTDVGRLEDKEQLDNLIDSQDRVLRGGCFNYFAKDVRSSARNQDQPFDANNNTGFRVARTFR